MMIKITINRDKCDGFGNCAMAAEDIFGLDDNGLVVLKRDTVGPDRQEAVRRAAYDCPTNAIACAET